MPYAFSLLFTLPGFVLCMLASGEVDVAAENEELVELRRLAEQGDADAQSKLGVMYDNPARACPKTMPKPSSGSAWPPSRALAIAQFKLGFMYAFGEGVPEDHAEAVKWFRMAAEQGHANAQFSLGFMYANGEGVPEDDAEAVKWFRMAAEQGLASAQFNLGFMYDNGEGRARRRCRSRQVVPHGCRAG